MPDTLHSRREFLGLLTCGSASLLSCVSTTDGLAIAPGGGSARFTTRFAPPTLIVAPGT